MEVSVRDGEEGKTKKVEKVIFLAMLHEIKFL